MISLRCPKATNDFYGIIFFHYGALAVFSRDCLNLDHPQPPDQHLFSPMGRQKNAVWAHFTTRNEELFDKVHKKAWCNSCLKHAIRLKTAEEEEAFKIGAISQKHCSEDIIAECKLNRAVIVVARAHAIKLFLVLLFSGQAEGRAHCGKVDVMLNHILDCQNALDNTKECASAKQWDEFWFAAQRRTADERDLLELLAKSASYKAPPNDNGESSNPIVVTE